MDIFKNKTVLFQGDSITDCGRDRSDLYDLGDGYVKYFATAYFALNPSSNVTFINKGISGDRTIDILNRYKDDIKGISFDVISLLVGINDTWRRYDSNETTSAEEFEKNYRQILDNIKNDYPKARIIIMEPFLIPTDPEKICFREDLTPKQEVIRKLALEYANIFVPLDKIFTNYIINGAKPKEISSDGVHPDLLGKGIIARELLKAINEI